MDSHFPAHCTTAYLVRRDYANCDAIRRSQFAHEMHPITFEDVLCMQEI